MKSKKHLYITAFGGGFIGCILFISIYGFAVLNVTNVDWILNAGGDLTQSYYGWRFFRGSEWHWPIGLMDNIAYPELTSIIYVDSVPLFNVIFKALSGILPETFQFFGLWGLLSFALSGTLGGILIYQLTNAMTFSIVGSILFSFNNIVLQRLYTHTALAANWLIILCLVGILSCVNDCSVRKHACWWGGMFFLCVSINMYYIPIIGILFLIYIAYYAVKHKNYKICLEDLMVSIFSVIMSFYLYGGFYHLTSNDAAPSGLGYYSANLNSLFNPMETEKYLSGYSTLLKSWPIATEGQYEGYAYLGAGILLLLISGLFIFLNRNSLATIKKIIKYYKNEILGIFSAVILLYIAALGTAITFCGWKLIEIPYPSFLIKIYSIFRSTGRFLWGIWDIVAIFAIYITWKIYQKYSRGIVLCICVVIQMVDFTKMAVIKHNQFNTNQLPYVSSLSSDEWNVLLKNKNEIVLLNKNPLRLYTFYDLADKSLKYNLGINDFYYSRRNSKEIERYKNKKYNDIVSGKKDKGDLYIVDTFDDMLKLLPYLNFYYIDGLLVGNTETVRNKKRITAVIPCEEKTENDQQQIILENLKPGTYGFEIMGDRAADSCIDVNQETISLYDKYDGGGLAMGIFTVSNLSQLNIQFPGENMKLNLYKLEMKN